MDVRNADVPPIIEHEGTVKSYFMFKKDELWHEAIGSFLEFVNEFELAWGERLEPHYHDTHEFYYILKGRGIMQIEAEKKEVGPGDLIHITRNVGHSIWSTVEGEPIRGLAFAVSFQEPGTQWVATALPD